MLHGWHGHNGVSLGNPRLGFVCTGMTVEGMPGLEGYYLEYDRELAPEERVRFAYGEERMPEAQSMPALDPGAWPEERLERTHRAYALEYVRTMLRVLPESAGSYEELARVARLMGLQYHEALAAELGYPTNLSEGTPRSAELFARWLEEILRGHGEEAERDGATVRIRGWRLGEGLPSADRAFAAWNELWVGACAAHDRFLTLSASRTDRGPEWSVAR
jgi:hypothetical protein